MRIDAKTGVLKWNQGLGSANFEVFKPIELKNIDGRPENVLVVTRGEVFTFNMDTGDEAVPPPEPGRECFLRSRGGGQHAVRGRGGHVLRPVS